VRVIHGIGTGALRAAVHSFLKNHPHVQRYAIAAQDEGGNGATVVELKK
jgi:DNA mismatch repair protein MutS2